LTTRTPRSSGVASPNGRRRQNDHGSPRSPDPSLRHPRDRKRELALQEPSLTPRKSSPPKLAPVGPQGPPARRCVSLSTGTPQRAGPPYGLPAQAAAKGPFCTPIWGPVPTPIDTWVL